MDIRQLLNESNKVDYINRNQGTRLEIRALQDTGRPIVSSDVLDKLKRADPTGDHYKYLQWIVNMYVKQQFKLEDVPRLKRDLGEFKRVRSKLDQRDINRYKNLPELYAALEPFKDVDVTSNREQDRALERHLIATGQAKILSTDPKVIELHSKEAAMFYGRGTKWCTAAEENNMFSFYYSGHDEYDIELYDDEADVGPLYVIILDGAKYQFHPASLQVMDAQDQPVAQATFVKMLEVPAVKKAFTDELDPVMSFLRTAKGSDLKDALREIQLRGDNLRLIELLYPDLGEVIISKLAQLSRSSWYMHETAQCNEVCFAINALQTELGYSSLPTEVERVLLDLPSTEPLRVYTKRYGRLRAEYVDRVVNGKEPPHKAVGVLGGRDPEIERKILTAHPSTQVEYAKVVIGGPWPELEDNLLAQSPIHAIRYAIHARKQRWPELEQRLADVAAHPSSVPPITLHTIESWVRLYDHQYNTNLSAAFDLDRQQEENSTPS